jgi:hypothetical protein
MFWMIGVSRIKKGLTISMRMCVVPNPCCIKCSMIKKRKRSTEDPHFHEKYRKHYSLVFKIVILFFLEYSYVIIQSGMQYKVTEVLQKFSSI